MVRPALSPRRARGDHEVDQVYKEKHHVTYVIAEPCVDIMELSCVSVCPVDCIHYEKGTDRMLYIEPNECIDCGACETECSVAAIFTEDALPEKWSGYTAVNALWFTDQAAARAQVDGLVPA